MRHESQKWDMIQANLEVVIAGAPITGLAPVVAIRRELTNEFYQGPGWGAGFAAIPMVELDPVNFPGHYSLQIGGVDLVAALGVLGYTAQIVEVVNAITEYVRIEQVHTPAEVAVATWSTDISSLIGNNQDVAAFIIDLLRDSLVCTEGNTKHICDAPHAGGTRFYTPSCPLPVVGRSDAFAGRLGAFYDDTTGEWELIRVASLGNDGDDYIEITLLDGASGMPGTIAVNDELILFNANDPSISEFMSAPMSSYSTDGTFGDWIRRMLSLRQNNTRVVWSAWNASGVPTAGKVLIYDSKADLLADSDPWPLATGEYAIVQTFDGSGRPATYTSVKDA